LTERFGGLTAHTRAPAEGLWKEDSSGTSRNEILIYEVMAEDLYDGWWGSTPAALRPASARSRWSCGRRRCGCSERTRGGASSAPP
jgi:hypothetical protein